MPGERPRLVYSTDGTEGGRVVGPATSSRKRRDGNASAQASRPAPPADGFVRVQREKQGRGGKTVTVITGVPGSPAEHEALLKALKQHCGAGGTVARGVLEIQGDHRERVRERLEALGYRVKLAGG